tara:strand:+ start:360 stop:557 length:198 start_codon:yes stop_codon:yes gene_type:complete
MNKCNKCQEGTMQSATYVCRENDYAILDADDNLLLKIKDHDLQSGDGEIGSNEPINYCSCGKYWS